MHKADGYDGSTWDDASEPEERPLEERIEELRAIALATRETLDLPPSPIPAPPDDPSIAHLVPTRSFYTPTPGLHDDHYVADFAPLEPPPSSDWDAIDEPSASSDYAIDEPDSGDANSDDQLAAQLLEPSEEAIAVIEDPEVDVDALSERIEALRGVLHDELRQLSSEVEVVTSQLPTREELAATLTDWSSSIEQTVTEVAGRLDAASADLPARVGERLQQHLATLRADLTTEIDEGSDTVKASIAPLLIQQEERLQNELRHAFEAHEEKLTASTQELSARVDASSLNSKAIGRQLAGEVNDSIARVEQALDTDRRNLPAEFERLQLMLREEASRTNAELLRQFTSMEHEISTSIERQRLQQATDVEMLLDALTSGWKAVFSRLERSDQRLVDLERKVDHWFASLDEEE